MDELSHLRRAIDLARASVATGGGPFGAVVVDAGGRVLGEGANRVVPHADPTAHAEVEAIRAAARARGSHTLDGCTLYASCEPCPMCLAAIAWARIGRVRYAASREEAAAAGFDDARLHAAFASPQSSPLVDARRELADEGRAPFRAWSEKTDRVPY